MRSLWQCNFEIIHMSVETICKNVVVIIARMVDMFSKHLVIRIWNNNQAKQIIWQSKDVIQDTTCSRSHQ